MRITEAERAVMEVLWTHAPSAEGSPEGRMGAAEIAAALTERDWSVRTVKTLLARLVEKGALQAEPEGRRYLYTPLIARAEHRREAVRGLSRRLFGGRATPMVAHLAEAGDLDPGDLDALERLVAELRAREGS